jgi:hypothetical protein
MAVATPIICAVLAGGALGIIVRSLRAAVWWTALLAPVAVLCAIATVALGESLDAGQPPRWEELLSRKGQAALLATALIAIGISSAGLLSLGTACGLLGTAVAVVAGRRGRSRG